MRGSKWQAQLLRNVGGLSTDYKEVLHPRRQNSSYKIIFTLSNRFEIQQHPKELILLSAAVALTECFV
jgi:hypothetical protein